MDVPVKVNSEGSTLYWKFQTSPGHDVGFGVLHISGEHAEPKEVLEVSRVKCDQVAEIGRLSAQPGTCEAAIVNIACAPYDRTH
ncbi:hypothetical protein HPB47_027620 [Ixodes persulcatus]|uniref:Uncharacterized protein n=1 Tax=Ixodes persulcatus TaxID=34615 RepID=A0AC60PXE7_IXOPE|nr:hypothetical protein HPB47_027620 [Ixodes persulcatus]